jgi:hypothetical protein
MSIDFNQKTSEGDRIDTLMIRLVEEKKVELRGEFRIRAEAVNIPSDFDIAVSILGLSRHLETSQDAMDVEDNIAAVHAADIVIDSLTTPTQVNNYDVVTMPNWA